MQDSEIKISNKPSWEMSELEHLQHRHFMALEQIQMFRELENGIKYKALSSEPLSRLLYSKEELEDEARSCNKSRLTYINRLLKMYDEIIQDKQAKKQAKKNAKSQAKWNFCSECGKPTDKCLLHTHLHDK